MTILGLTLLLLGMVSVGYTASLFSFPQVQTYQDIPYLSGGIAEEEREALRQMAQEYNVQLIFAAKEGNYVSDVTVKIEDGRGRKVLEALSNGPWFYTKLPPGKYAIIARFGEQTHRRVAQVGQQKQTQLQFYW